MYQILLALCFAISVTRAAQTSIDPAVQVTFDTESDRFYQVETSSSFARDEWAPVGPTHWGRGWPRSQTIPTAPSTKLFFRTREFDLTNQLYALVSLDGAIPRDGTLRWSVSAKNFVTNRFGTPNHAGRNIGDSSDVYGVSVHVVQFAQGTNDFTISFWAKGEFDVPSPASFGNILSTVSTRGIYLVGTNNTIQLRLARQTTPIITSGPVTWENNRWYNFQIVRANENLSIYRDTELVGETTNPPPLFSEYFDFFFGPKRGGVDDIWLHNRALSRDELRALFRLNEH